MGHTDKMSTPFAFAAVAIVAAGLLVGCAPSTSGPAAPIDSTSSPSAEIPPPAPAPTPTPVKPALDGLVLTTEGLGNLAIGAPVPDVAQPLALVAFYPEYGCYQPNGAWLSTYESPPLLTTFVIRTENFEPSAEIDWILVKSPLIKSDRGIGAGDSRDAVLAAYPEAQQLPDSHPYVDLYSVTGTRGMLLFEISTADSEEYPPDELLWLRTVSVDYPYIYPIANSGAGGPCEA